MKRLYVYALLSEQTDLTEPGAGWAGEPARIVRAGGLAAVVGEVEEAPAIDLSHLRAHDALVRRVAGSARAVLPLRFGQVVADEAALGELVQRALPRLRAALAQVEDCEQTTLRVFGAQAPPRTAADEGANGRGPGARYLARRLAARRDEATPPAVLAPVLARVAPLVRAQRVDARTSVASVYQLVRRADAEPYRRLLEEALATVQGVRVSDPAPPYAFAGGWSS